LSGERKRNELHPAKARDIIKAPSKLGFSARHTKSSHVFLKHADGRTTIVPVHPREEIDRTLFRKIASDIGLEPKELMYLVDES
jgi:predicted RNA binding protein YcfA (HicA-like mRNA interferase family)